MGERNLLTVYVKSSCGTCARTIDYLNEKKASFRIVDIFNPHLRKEEIRKLLEKANTKPVEAIRKKDSMYKKLQMDIKQYSDDQVLDLMSEHLGLLLRPIVTNGEKAIITVDPTLADQLL